MMTMEIPQCTIIIIIILFSPRTKLKSSQLHITPATFVWALGCWSWRCFVVVVCTWMRQYTTEHINLNGNTLICHVQHDHIVTPYPVLCTHQQQLHCIHIIRFINQTDSPAGGFLLVIVSTAGCHQCVMLERVNMPDNGTTFQQLGIPPHPNRFLGDEKQWPPYSLPLFGMITAPLPSLTVEDALGTVKAKGCCCCCCPIPENNCVGAGEDTSENAKEAAELRDPAPDRSSPPIDEDVPCPELIEVTPESLSSILHKLQNILITRRQLQCKSLSISIPSSSRRMKTAVQSARVHCDPFVMS